jgi:hypothetical protein
MEDKEMRDLQIEIAEGVSTDEMLRVSHNWKTQPGVRIASSFLAALGMALERGNPDQIEVIKEAFPTEWETWNDEFDPKTGRLILDLEEDEDGGTDRDAQLENHFDSREHYRG